MNQTGGAVQIREYKRILAEVNPAILVCHIAGNHDVGIHVVIVREEGIEHHCYEPGEIPDRTDPGQGVYH